MPYGVRRPLNNIMADEPKMEPPELLLDEKMTEMFTGNRHDRAALHDLSLLMPFPAGADAIKGLMVLSMLVLHWLSFPVEMVIRRDFGIRYISLVRFFVASSIAGFLRIFFTVFFGFGWLGYLFSWVVMIMFFWHYWKARRKLKRGEIWYTMSWGISRFEWLLGMNRKFNAIPFFPQFDDWYLYRFVEPAFLVIVSTIVYQYDTGLALLLYLSTAGMFLKANLTYSNALNTVYDIIDAAVQGQYFQPSAGGSPKESTAGFAAVQLPKVFTKRHMSGSSDQVSAEIGETVGQTLGQRPCL